MKQKKHTKKQTILIVFIVLLIAWGIGNLLPGEKRATKPFFNQDRPMIIAHQGGEHLAPSSTMAAFNQAVELGVDAIEFDIHITKDQHLVAIHDPTVDRTTDGVGRVDELSLEEIKELDAGFYFQDQKGEYSFRGRGEKILTVNEIFDEFSNSKMVIEIKDTNALESYELIVTKLWNLIVEYELEEKVLIASFDQEIIDMVDELAEGKVAISGGKSEVTQLVVLNKVFLNGLYKPSVDVIQIPTEEMIFDLTSKRLIKAANRKGLEVHYWTINDIEAMRYLLNQGASGL
ncbi:glycerophosphodiester phosphodiesterase [Halalkalibacter akibai]|uniref:Glycerophosphoryl diester phosphodiesterase n=1 Tax=Halalkalibacter akibai (strain ATCC 43226 / DSM 21942 / CIP 109018 / JCM 9157 / 1139) TaxID=1236973 RepID=W4QR31_HALA3|nr:glycerophosphodiester phosphodiesterase [Halalkalibacter akibai]GAE34382.1 glycerophosphoryl diester phosphodiesterase [Halalkalibacter akibai JCM 9157]